MSDPFQDHKPITEAELKEMEKAAQLALRIGARGVPLDWLRLIAEVRRLRAFIRAKALQQREIWWFCIGCDEGENEDTAFHDLAVPLDDGEGGEERSKVEKAFVHSPDCPVKGRLDDGSEM